MAKNWFKCRSFSGIDSNLHSYKFKSRKSTSGRNRKFGSRAESICFSGAIMYECKFCKTYFKGVGYVHYDVGPCCKRILSML